MDNHVFGPVGNTAACAEAGNPSTEQLPTITAQALRPRC